MSVSEPPQRTVRDDTSGSGASTPALRTLQCAPSSPRMAAMNPDDAGQEVEEALVGHGAARPSREED